MTKDKAIATWSDEVPTKADAGDAYYFVRRKDKLDVVIMGFSMGKGWLIGVSYDASEMRNHLFLGPITPDLFAEVARLREALDTIGGGKCAWASCHYRGSHDADCHVAIARAALSSERE